MSLLKGLASDASIANERDSVGGSRVVESALYPLTITLAYVMTAASGALGLVLSARTEDKKDIKQTLWMSSGRDKGGKNYYEKDGEKNYLPGYILANSLALLTVGKEISELDTEQKVVNAYSPEAKAEVPTKVDMIMDLVGKEILGGVIKQTVDKTKKNDAGVYVATGETRDENEFDKFFRIKDRMTTAEIRAEATTAVFADAWAAKNTGVTRNKAGKSGSNGTAGAPGKPKVGAFGQATAAATATTKKPTSSLFG